ncbi:MAG: 3-oxoacid CoA-transferase subunit A [Chloroflexota bacterium]|nr:3-oxoacid CoA-transferase subunit A [Chloroflexota bacterium]
MINKIYSSIDEASYDIHDGSSVMIGGFGGIGSPHNLVQAMSGKARELTLICGSIGAIMALKDVSCIKRLISGYVSTLLAVKEEWARMAKMIDEGEIGVELVPFGNFVERIRTGGSGIPAFYTPVGAATIFGKDKETRIFEGRECFLERALRADFALIRAHKADRMGNLAYRKTARNYNPIMAMAADVTIVQADEIVEVGELEPDCTHTPGIFVDRVVHVEPALTKFARVRKRT